MTVVPFVLLGVIFGAYVGSVPLLAASAFTVVCGLFVWIARARGGRRQRLY